MEQMIERPLPIPAPESRPYWEGCRRHELLIQRCQACGQYQFFPRVLCRACLSSEMSWERARGTGRVYTFSTVYRAPSAFFSQRSPYTLAMIQLDEGVQMLSEVVGCAPDAVALDMPVEVVFEDVTDEITLPKFRPRPGGERRRAG